VEAHVPGGSDILFESDGIRDGGRHATAVADAAGAVAEFVAGIAVDPAAFGRLPAASALGTSLAAFRDGHAELGRQVQAAHVDLAGRAAGAGRRLHGPRHHRGCPRSVGAASPAMTTVDLSLPTDAQLLASARPNPEVEAAQVTGGDPDHVADIGSRLRRAGVELDRVHQDSTRTQHVLAGSFANGGAPVYDAQTHRDALPAGFADAGTRLHDAGRRVSVLSLELGSAIDDVTAAQTGLFQTLDGRRRSFAAEVQAALGPAGLIPEAQVPALQGRRASVAAQMQELTNSCGRDVANRVGRYQTVLEGCQRLLGELGVPGALPGATRPGLPGLRLEGRSWAPPSLRRPARRRTSSRCRPGCRASRATPPRRAAPAR
jgi:hypothetical protein